MICGAERSERQVSSLASRLWVQHGAIALLLTAGTLLGWGIVAADGPELSQIALPSFGVVIVALASWRLVTALVVIPRRTIVWFQYDRPTLEFRRRGDFDVRRLRTLDILRIDSTTDARGEIVRYHIRVVGGTCLVIERSELESGDALAEQLAADIAHSPRWMFP